MKTNKNVFWAYLVHILTAVGAFIGLLSLDALAQGHYKSMFLYMSLAMFIDGVDGFFARKFKVSTYVKNIDGCLLDNMVDYFNYTLVPCFFIIQSGLLGPYLGYISSFFIVMSSSYQFTHKEAKTEDNFFLGFPSYWNIVVFYLYLFSFGPWVNFGVLSALCLLSFIPIKYVYPSRMQYVFRDKKKVILMTVLTYLWAGTGLYLILNYPSVPEGILWFTILFWGLYFSLGIYRTLRPLES